MCTFEQHSCEDATETYYFYDKDLSELFDSEELLNTFWNILKDSFLDKVFRVLKAVYTGRNETRRFEKIIVQSNF